MWWWVVLHQQRQPGRPGVHGPAHGRSSMSFSSATRIGLFGVGGCYPSNRRVGGRPFPIRMRNIKDVMLRLILWTDHDRNGPRGHGSDTAHSPTGTGPAADRRPGASGRSAGSGAHRARRLVDRGPPGHSPARRAAGRRADDRVVVKFDGWPLLRRPARCAILGTCKSGQAHQDPSQTPTNQHSLRSSMLSVRPRAPRRTPSRSCLVVVVV